VGCLIAPYFAGFQSPISLTLTQPFHCAEASNGLSVAVVSCTGKFGGDNMLWTIFVVLLVLWLLGVVSSYTLGGFIHILLVLAVIALVFQLISGRRTAV
jgi:hypothetical protein